MVRWLLGGLAGAALVASVVALWPLRALVPMVQDDLTLDRVVVAVALDWRDFGLARAVQRLQYELDAAGIGPWVDDADCGLREADDGVREVRCAWEVVIDHELLGVRVPVSFESVAHVDAGGLVEG